MNTFWKVSLRSNPSRCVTVSARLWYDARHDGACILSTSPNDCECVAHPQFERAPVREERGRVLKRPAKVR